MTIGLSIAAVAALALWVLLAFVIAIPAGWAHIPLAVGTVLIATAIVKGGDEGRERDERRETGDQRRGTGDERQETRSRNR